MQQQSFARSGQSVKAAYQLKILL